MQKWNVLLEDEMKYSQVFVFVPEIGVLLLLLLLLCPHTDSWCKLVLWSP